MKADQNTEANIDHKGISWEKRQFSHPERAIRLATSFSGIGAPEHALQRLGFSHKIVFAGDIDDYCRQTYFANYEMSDDAWHNDVRQFNALPYNGLIDLFVGGSPCQSFSIGGKRKGFEEARGTLFYEYARLVKECQPKVFIYENVTGLLNHNGGHTWKVVKNVFDDLNYHWVYWILNSKDFGIPQNRRRVFVVGFRKDLHDYYKLLKEPKTSPLIISVQDLLDEYVPNKYYLPQKGFERVVDPKHARHVALNGTIARTQIANQQYNWYGDIRIEKQISEEIENDDRIFKGFYQGERCVARCLTPRECLRLMGFEDTFQIVVNDQQQYKQCGNSIVVNVMMEIMKTIINTGVFYAE